MYWIVEKENRLAVHGHFDSLERAQRHLALKIPDYVNRGFFMDKTLRPSDFEIVNSRNGQ